MVNELLNPEVKEENTSALLGLTGGFNNQSIAVSITGQIKSLGVPVSNAGLQLIGPSLSTQTKATTSTTNTFGRFYLNVFTGPVTLQLTDISTIVNIQLEVTPTSLTVISIDHSEYKISNLEVYDLGVEPPTYLELLFSIPYDGMLVDENNINLFGENLTFAFSEDLEMPGDLSTWAIENVSISPSIVVSTASISNSDALIYLNNEFDAYTNYTLTLNSGIKSISGKSLKPTTIQFRVDDLGN
ncbi:Ig-like domain-containing protein [Leptospira sp. 201903075]|uniref:Ig-like domain-containing protein n=1 Tax=Leptospira chreensis TaxID=2810035 RepID=UPI001962BBA4|nr:Ig-like domain-containing protein [Leptospira chreensis]MBM9592420.1 Ig-like domain-containing protein [Leptospira chreensis]MBM9592748.1 Ig-like domain-containing protein [Leptospira chreensis]